MHDDWIDTIRDNHTCVWNIIQAANESYGDDMGAFSCFLGIRALEMHRVLKHTGSLYLHCDPTASHYIKMLLDCVFGRKNFRNEITWKRTDAHNDGRGYGRIADHILFYTKSDSYTWNALYTDYSPEYVTSEFRHKDDRGPFKHADLTAGSLAGGGYEYEFHGHNRVWKRPLHSMRELETDGRIYVPKKGGGVPRYKIYLAESKGIPLQNIWTDIEKVGGNQKVGYPTQKPLALYERIIRASSNPGDLVLDPFAGCATTCVAAEKLGRSWIGIDVWEKTHDVTMDRLKRECWLATDSDGRPDLLAPVGVVELYNDPPVRADIDAAASPSL